MSTKSSILAIPTTHFIQIILIFVSLCSTYHVVIVVATHNIQATLRPNREALGIVIGGEPISIGGSPAPEMPKNCPPPQPPPTPCPPPPSSPPPSLGESRVQIATNVIQQFIKGIDTDNCSLSTKVKYMKNPNLCANPKFGCAPLPNKKENGLYSIQFNGCYIKGKNITLDNFINNVPDVSIFHANSNYFGGKIPVLSGLPYLFELDLSNNKYTGKFPINVLSATKLTFLDLRFNQFVGPVPPELFNLQVLALFINNNYFEQDLPLNLGSTPAAFLTFAHNRFTGPIPRSIGQASNTLLEVLFLDNSFSGCLPYEIGLLKKARVFDVSKNVLTGPIPRSFACLGKMEYLVLEKNEFYGPVPEEVCMLPHLRKLSLCDNYFTQVGPECMKLIQKGVLDVRHNCILGLPDQRSPDNCAFFFKRPKTCGDFENKMHKYLPCKKTAPYLNAEMLIEGVPQPQPSVTYAALSP
ncbi:uncharacterized protein At4g06744-like [Chenopodium quinoa]|uniref:uncharacterized protein At4g06744-like n=1 Tax=Chenopodium quinoa TaxID=63459 RepID=UPI000B79A893|nr:uncharacterized protein At4g06744-like [Chenopodium quinoa]